MLPRGLLLTILFAGCLGGGMSPPDSGVDAPDGSGSAFDSLTGPEISPPDVTLQWIVVGLSAAVIIGSAARRRNAKPFELW